MKKTIIVLFCFMVLIVVSKGNESNVIPAESIRYRIIASSNSAEDQQEKWNVNFSIIPLLDEIATSSKNLIENRQNITKNLPRFEKLISNSTKDFSLNFGQNYFPEKVYKGVSYPAGEYESLVITLGDGLGDNWWCIMFPPLCLLEASASNLEDVEYKSYFKTIINKYF